MSIFILKKLDDFSFGLENLMTFLLACKSGFAHYILPSCIILDIKLLSSFKGDTLKGAGSTLKNFHKMLSLEST